MPSLIANCVSILIMPYSVLPPEPPPLIQPVQESRNLSPSETLMSIPLNSLQKESCKWNCQPTPYEKFTMDHPGNTTSSAKSLGYPVEVEMSPPSLEVERSFAEEIKLNAFTESVGGEFEPASTLKVYALSPTPLKDGEVSQKLEVDQPNPLDVPSLPWDKSPNERKNSGESSFSWISEGLGKVPKGKKRSSKPPVNPVDLVEVKADQQDFDQNRQLVSARGNVLIRFRQSVVDANYAVLNLTTRQLLAEGDVSLKRGNQVLRGTRMDYNLAEQTGVINNAYGEVDLRKSSQDFSLLSPTELNYGGMMKEPLSDRLAREVSLRGVKSAGGLTVVLGGGQQLSAPKISGEVSRLRFFAERIDLLPDGSRIATNLRLTNDPFSPPELELRARQATIKPLGNSQSEIVTTPTQFVFDQGLKISTLAQRQVLGPDRRNGQCLGTGYDYTDRGGFYLQCVLEPEIHPSIRLTLIPQFFIQRSWDLYGGSPFHYDNFGFVGRVSARFGPTSELSGRINVLSFNFGEEEIRGRLQFQQLVEKHTLSGQYAYRERVFNGSLGQQTVRTLAGVLLTSPQFILGDSLIRFNYQAGYHFINSETDQSNLILPGNTTGRVSTYRFQASAGLKRIFQLWRGTPLPRTATQGLRYTKDPVVPGINFTVSAVGVTSLYNNGYHQNSLTGTVGLEGQFGHFSRNYLDYTAFSISYSQGLLDGFSPFFFDRYVDQKVLGLGFSQQIYDGWRFGVQTSRNLDTGYIFSTDYILEYSRRTYGLILRYNPQRQIGTFNLRITDFNWNGSPEPFPDMNTVNEGVIESQ